MPRPYIRAYKGASYSSQSVISLYAISQQSHWIRHCGVSTGHHAGYFRQPTTRNQVRHLETSCMECVDVDWQHAVTQKPSGRSAPSCPDFQHQRSDEPEDGQRHREAPDETKQTLVLAGRVPVVTCKPNEPTRSDLDLISCYHATENTRKTE